MRASNLRDRIVAILRQPFGIKCLRSLIVENVLEPVFPQKPHGFFELLSQLGIIAVNDRVYVFLQEHFEQRTAGAAGARAQGAGNLGRKITEHRHNAVRIARERFEKMTVPLGPVARHKIRPVFV